MANLLFSTFTLLSFCLFSYSLSSLSNYTLPQTHFINCGSDSSITVGSTIFTGDRKTFSGDSYSSNNPTSNGVSPLYQTARIFKKGLSWYKFQVEEKGVYMVKLHFYPFSSQDNLFNSRFDVLACGYLLLSNFSVSMNQTLPLVKEFLLPVFNSSTLRIIFRTSSFAFINAIEAFVTPQDFLPDSAEHVTFQENGKKVGRKDVSSNGLRIIHRINVGGSVISPERDTMLRNWVPDDEFLILSDSARNAPYRGAPSYELGGATNFDAPDLVYSTAKEMNVVGVGRITNNSNITWRFDVNKNTTFFVRFHFCDIVSVTRNQTVFNLYIYGVFRRPVMPFDDGVTQLAAPFYHDFVVDSDGSGFMDISVGPRSESPSPNAFLNGVEIMELVRERASVPEENDENQTNKRLTKIVGSAVGGGVVLAFVSALVVLFFLEKSRKAKSGENVDWRIVNVYGGSSHTKTTERTTLNGSTTSDMNLGLKITLGEILYATNNFDPKFMIGEGGFGKVYKGCLHNGVKVAVKRSEPGHGQGLMEFETEITVLSKIRHHHLVSLIGYCDERNEMILVYEFMEKGTLREHLYRSNEDVSKSSSRSELSWIQRLEICIGAAKGLHYLHTGLPGSIIHRDIKSTNILLDEHYVAKVADFGLSKSGPLDQTYISTDVKGSFGYLDPEYLRCMQLTLKSDVYSFGVVLLEVLCARAAVNNMLPRSEMNLAEWGVSWQKQNQLERIIDPVLAGKINPNSLRKFGETVEKCLQENGVDRPKMVDVLWDLKYALKLQQSAMPQEFHEDSATDVSWQMALPGIHRLPSINMTTTSYASDSEVFSQMKIDEAT